MIAGADMQRRRFLGIATAALGTAVAGCESPPPDRYNQADIDLLAAQRDRERREAGRGPHGPQVYRGYRGLAGLPWFDLDAQGNLVCTHDEVPQSIDVHAHLGISALFRPHLDLLASTPRVQHLLDCDATEPGCELDLDIYINGNFTEDGLASLQSHTLGQVLWGSDFMRTHTVPNLLREMDAMRVQHSLLLPIKLGLPFGDSLTSDWRGAVDSAAAGERLHVGLSVFPGDEGAIEEMRAHAAAGARIMKLHPTVQSFYPDDPAVMPLYEEAERLGLVVFFHGGRAGIEPDSRHRYAMPRHYEGALAEFPRVQFILGHGGARDGEAMLALAARYDNAWLGMHGQGVTHIERMIQRTGGERMLFGTDWPWYHLGASLAKVLLVTVDPGRRELRSRLLRDNALQLFPELAQAA